MVSVSKVIVFKRKSLKEKKTLGKNTVGEIDCDIN